MSTHTQYVHGEHSMNVVTVALNYIKRVTGGEARQWRQEMRRQEQASIRATRKLNQDRPVNWIEDTAFPNRRKRPVE